MTINLEIMDLEQDIRHRHMVFSKMQALIADMQHEERGIPVKSKKNFLTTIQKAFTGSDLILWLKDRVKITDSAEALHLANLLCQHGYLYPVDFKNYCVKDDKSCLYRFQCPYYWPSNRMKPDSVEYAIHLAQRDMRNKHKHGLDEFEQYEFAMLQKVLGDKIEFIFLQARDQVREVKQLKSQDKIVRDSQERAFWRIYRPPPGQVRYLEESPNRNFQPKQIYFRRRKNRDLCLKNVQYLRKAVGRPKMRFSKVIELYQMRFKQYLSYDPLIDPSAAQPSNPWISYDTTMWDLNLSLVEMPTVLRVKKWGISFHEFLSDATGRLEFELFLKKEYSQENIKFWEACQDLKHCTRSQVSALIEDIHRKFLLPGAPCEVNIDGQTMELVHQNMRNVKIPNRFAFEPAVEHIYALMKKDSYQRFMRSTHYQSLLANALQPGGRKKFFNFGNARRHAQTPSPKPRRKGSSSSDRDIDSLNSDSSSGVVAHHSYSTGNLRELEDNAVAFRGRFKGSDGSMSWSSMSPASVRRRSEEAARALSVNRRKSNLEVPKPYLCSSTDQRKSEATLCLALSVPTKTNIVAPWEGSE